MMELRKNKDDSKGDREMLARQLIRMPKEEQRKNLPHSILAVENGGRVSQGCVSYHFYHR